MVSVVSNGIINWQDEEPIKPEAPVGFLTARSLRTDPDLAISTRADGLISTAEVMFRSAMSGSPVINLAERDAVLFSRAYQDARVQRRQISLEMALPAGYKLIDTRDRNFFSALARETGLQRSMIVEFDLTKAMISGLGKNGNFRAELTMIVTVLDAQGRAIFRDSYSLSSDDTIRAAEGVYSESGLIGLFEPVIGDAYRKFLSQLNM